ncbi:MAG: HD domain-containing protein [bacterium]|nr:HD domain-containing protein [bacterium]
MLEVFNHPQLNNIKLAPIKFRANVSHIKDFGLFEKQDIFENGNKYVSESIVKSAIQKNPNILKILRENNLPVKINVKELEALKAGHMKDTRVIVAKMHSSLPNELKQEVNLQDLQNAAMCHDVGKSLIPEKILNKKGKLTSEEKEIMDLHSELGYEILKGSGLNKNTLEIIKYHHQTLDGAGYPTVGAKYECPKSVQILNVADKYSALTEERAYKKAFSREDALNIISEDVKNGKIASDVFEVLNKVV